jgi:hypothetical protein
MSLAAWSNMADVQVGGREKSVLMYLADQATPEGVVFMPQIEAISRRTCWSGAEVELALAALKTSGHLRALTTAEARAVPPALAGPVFMLEANPPA